MTITEDTTVTDGAAEGVQDGPAPVPPPPQAGDRVHLRRELFEGRAGTAVLIAAMTAMSVGCTLLLPMVVASMIDAVQRGQPFGAITAVLVTVGLGAAVAGALAAHLLSRLGERMVHRLRMRVVEHSLRMRAADVEALGTGNLAGRLGPDALQLKAAVDVGPVQLPVAGFTFVGTVAIMAALDWVLLLVTLAGFAVALVLVGVVVVALRTRYTVLQENLGALMQRFVGTLDALTVIKSTRTERAQAAILGRYAEKLRATGVDAAKLESLVVPTITLGQQVALVAVLIGGGARLVSGHLTLGAFVAFLLYLLQLTAPLVMASTAVSTVQAGLTARRRFDSVLQAPIEAGETHGEPVDTPTVAAPAVELVDVNAGYGPDPALRGVSLVVPPVGLTSLVGPSGAGKTTILRLVERLLTADRGEVRVFGDDVRRQDLDRLRSRIVYVDQGCTLVPGTVRENLELGSFGPRGDAALHAALTRVGMDTEVAAMQDGLDTVLDGGRSLSGGQSQRLALARAVLSDAPLVLLDEPTSALDAGNEHRLREVITDIARERAVLVVAHRISTVRDARHVIVLDGGGVRAQGTHCELIETCPLYAELVDLQMLTTTGGAR